MAFFRRGEGRKTGTRYTGF